jgi:hypothetical protein
MHKPQVITPLVDRAAYYILIKLDHSVQVFCSNYYVIERLYAEHLFNSLNPGFDL